MGVLLGALPPMEELVGIVYIMNKIEWIVFQKRIKHILL